MGSKRKGGVLGHEEEVRRPSTFFSVAPLFNGFLPYLFPFLNNPISCFAHPFVGSHQSSLSQDMILHSLLQLLFRSTSHKVYFGIERKYMKKISVQAHWW